MGVQTGLADGLDKRVDPRFVTVQRIAGAITSVIAIGTTFAAIIVAMVAADEMAIVWRLVLVASWVVFSASLAGFTLLWPPVRYRHMGYRICDDAIYIRNGALWRSISTVPRSRVQHTDVSQGPIERAFELSTLIVYTAGTQHASVHLPGLDRETALAIRDHLIDGGEGDAV